MSWADNTQGSGVFRQRAAGPYRDLHGPERGLDGPTDSFWDPCRQGDQVVPLPRLAPRSRGLAPGRLDPAEQDAEHRVHGHLDAVIGPFG
jgi:hypothetical protein